MANPTKVSRSGREERDIADCAWNGFVWVCCTDKMNELSPLQRPAGLVFAYLSEVCNGGHFQYFCNREDLDHTEVVAALQNIGAVSSAEILIAAIGINHQATHTPPRTVEEYIQLERTAGMEALDTKYYDIGYDECLIRLQEYLNKHENEFVTWVE